VANAKGAWDWDCKWEANVSWACLGLSRQFHLNCNAPEEKCQKKSADANGPHQHAMKTMTGTQKLGNADRDDKQSLKVQRIHPILSNLGMQQVVYLTVVCFYVFSYLICSFAAFWSLHLHGYYAETFPTDT